MDDSNKLLLGAAAGGLVLIFALRGKSNAIQQIPAGGTDSLGMASLQADTFKTLAANDLERYRITKDSELSTYQSGIAERLGFHTADVALEAERVRGETEKFITVSRGTFERDIANAQASVGIAQANANLRGYEIAASTEAARIQAALQAERDANLAATQQAEIQRRAAQAAANAQRNGDIFSTIFNRGFDIVDAIFDF
jgi:hypothetical protein